MHLLLAGRFIYAKTSYSVHSKEDIKKVVYEDKSKATVYSGAQSRIIGLTKRIKQHVDFYDWFSCEIYSYLNNGVRETMSSFDEWHHKLCDSFISRLSKIGITAHYGMAQKYVNLAMKYVYCFEDSNTIDDSKFQYCHIALDGYTYCPSSSFSKYIISRRYSGYVLNTPFYVKDVTSSSCHSKMTPWSKLGYGGYIKIQNEMRRYFVAKPLTYGHVSFLDVPKKASSRISTSYQLTPFESEFFIW